MSEPMMAVPDPACERPRAASQLVSTLQELIEALDRRIPQIERVGEAEITADAVRLRASAIQRLALLRLHSR